MLRPFRSELGVGIGPGKVLLVRMRGGWRRKCIAERALSVGTGNPSDWQPALEALERELEAESWTKTDCRVVVSNHWVHYEVLPWSIELSSESERLQHARYLLAATYGEVAEQWTVVLSDAAPGAPRMVTALPTSLIEALETLLARFKIRLVSLQPQLVAAYNLWRHRLPGKASWFASIDEGSLVAMHLADGRCDRVRAVRISDDWSLELKRIQTMGRLAQSRPAEGPMFVDAPLCVRTMSGGARAGVEWLETEKTAGASTLARLAALKELNA